MMLILSPLESKVSLELLQPQDPLKWLATFMDSSKEHMALLDILDMELPDMVPLMAINAPGGCGHCWDCS